MSTRPDRCLCDWKWDSPNRWRLIREGPNCPLDHSQALRIKELKTMTTQTNIFRVGRDNFTKSGMAWYRGRNTSCAPEDIQETCMVLTMTNPVEAWGDTPEWDYNLHPGILVKA